MNQKINTELENHEISLILCKKVKIIKFNNLKLAQIKLNTAEIYQPQKS